MTTTREPLATVDHGQPERLWWSAARLWVVVLCFVSVAVVRAVQVDLPFRDPHGSFLIWRIAETAAIFCVLVVVDGVLRTARKLDVGHVRATLRARWTPERLALAWIALIAYHTTYFSYRNLKSWNAFNPVHDQLLLRWDRWLFLGHSPAVLLHNLLGEHAAAWVLTIWYETFPTLVVIAFPAAVVLARRMLDAYVSIAALIWVWILGTATYYAIPALGPFHAAPGEFAGLPHTMVQDTQHAFMSQRADLLTHPHASGAYAQLGAFASLHVGVTAVILGIAWWHRMRRTTTVLAVFLLGTILATVYLGWHYAVDDAAGLAIAALAWWLAPRTVGARRPTADS